MPTKERRLQRERSNDIRHGVIAALKDNIGDEFTAAEIAAAIDGICTIESTRQLGGVLKSMRVDGLMTNRVKGNHSVWALQANALDVNVRPSLSMSKNNKPADNHPWKEKVCQPRAPRAQPIACELPVNLLTPKPSFEERCPSSLMQDQEEPLEIAPAALGLPELVDVTESIEDEPYPPLTQFLIHEVEERERVLQGNEAINERHCTGQCQSETQLTHADARDDYLRLLITIADDAAVNGEQLKDWPIWTRARALAPHFHLETCYA